MSAATATINTGRPCLPGEFDGCPVLKCQDVPGGRLSQLFRDTDKGSRFVVVAYLTGQPVPLTYGEFSSNRQADRKFAAVLEELSPDPPAVVPAPEASADAAPVAAEPAGQIPTDGDDLGDWSAPASPPDAEQPTDAELRDALVDAAAVSAEIDSIDLGPVAELADTDDKKFLFRVLRRRGQLEAELDRVKAHSAAMVQQLQSQLDQFDFCTWSMAQEIVKRLLEGGKTKSLKTPFGVAGFRLKPAKLEIEDEDKVLAAIFAGEVPGEAEELVKTESKIVKSALDAIFKETGEIPPGCQVVPEENKFYVKHD